jgi:hypothetical protein
LALNVRAHDEIFIGAPIVWESRAIRTGVFDNVRFDAGTLASQDATPTVEQNAVFVDGDRPVELAGWLDARSPIIEFVVAHNREYVEKRMDLVTVEHHATVCQNLAGPWVSGHSPHSTIVC